MGDLIENDQTGTSSNSNINESEESNRPACAACRHQRKKCKKGCPFFLYFPADKQEEFKAVHQIFGISNLTKMLKNVDLEYQPYVVKSAIWEAMIWMDKIHKEHGPLGIYNELQEKLKQSDEALREISDQLEKLKSQSLISYSTPSFNNSFNREERYHPQPVASSTQLAPSSNNINFNVGPINSHPRNNLIQYNTVVADSIAVQELRPPIQQAILPVSSTSSQLDYNTNMIVPLNSRNSMSNDRYHPYSQQPQQFIHHGRHNYLAYLNQYPHQPRYPGGRVVCQQIQTLQNNNFRAEQHNEVRKEKGTKDSNGA